MNSIVAENIDQKNEFIRQNVIRNILSRKTNKYMEYRKAKILDELNKLAIVPRKNRTNMIIQELNRINISFKKIPLRFQLNKICSILKYDNLLEYYNINFYKNKNKYESLWLIYCN
jgi:hypothetical protein